MDQSVLVLSKIEIGRSWRHILRRRLNFCVRYIVAKRRSKVIVKLVPILERQFDHPWVAGIELTFRFWPGSETELGQMWRLYKSLPRRSMSWDAPIALTVYRERRGKKRQAFCMSLYLERNILCIAQFQGSAGTDVPKELRAWPRRFIEACRAFVRQEGIKELRVPKAETLYSYRNPYLDPRLTSTARNNTLLRIRRSMKLLYDANALELGFVPDGDWFKWEGS